MTLEEINNCIEELVHGGVEFFDDSTRTRLVELLKDAPYEWNDENIMKVFNATVEPLVDDGIVDKKGNVRDNVHVVADHSLRVAALAKRCVELGKVTPFGRTADEIKNIIYQAGLLHDIGKCCVPKKILFDKSCSLNQADFEKVKLHVKCSGYLCDILFKNVPREAWTAINQHHHKRVGRSYEGLIRGTIPTFFDRMVGAADSAEVIQTKDRTYQNTRNNPDASFSSKVIQDMRDGFFEADEADFLVTINEELMMAHSFDANGNFDVSPYSEFSQSIINKHISEETYRKAGSGPERGKDK